MVKNKIVPKNNANKSKGKWYFLIAIFLLYLIIYFISGNNFILIGKFFIKLIFQILPIFFLVYVLMVLINYFINNEMLKKYLGEEAGIKGWVIAIIIGIISMGPIYMWYPLMKDLQEKGVKDKFLATFLYNRGIKLQWAPLLVLYFGWVFSLTLLVVMVFFSIPQGVITEKLINIKSNLLNNN